MRAIRALSILFLAAVVLGCAHDPGPYLAALDGLKLPAAWQVAQTTVQSQGGTNGCIEALNGRCPSVTRYYVADGSLTDVLAAANEAVTTAGFGSIDVLNASCETPSSGPPCSLTATKDDMALQVNVYRLGDDVDGLGLSRPDRPTVRMILTRN